MKKCPQCGRGYNDDSLSFCLDDGSELLFGPASADEPSTAILHETAPPGEAATRAQIESVRVASRVRGLGIGHQLVEWAMARARERGARIAQLSTDKTRLDAHRFYETLGFRATHEGMKLRLDGP